MQAAKELLQQYNAQPVSIMARYACAYSTIKKRDWWDTAICGGPIVEQVSTVNHSGRSAFYLLELRL